MADKFSKFLKKSAGEGLKDMKGLGGAFVAFDIANLARGENKLKSIWNIFSQLLLMRPSMAALFTGVFTGFGKTIRSLVHDTGSLQAALQKLANIQGLNKLFAPLVGGADAAKRKVAELVNFAASKNIKLGDAAGAEKMLLTMTRGAFSGTKALDALADVAKGTGNTLGSVSEKAAQFYDTLRGGAAIDGVTEEMRQMGMISQSTANELVKLQENGASAGAIFDRFKGSLSEFSGAAASAKGDIEGVNEAFESAKKSLAEKFASPWVKDDVETTKSYTEALKGIAPVVESLSGIWSNIFNGTSRLKASFLEWAANNAVVKGSLEVLGVAVTALVSVLGALGGIRLAAWLMEAGAAFQFTTGFMNKASVGLSRFTLGLITADRATKLLTFSQRALSLAMKATGLLALVSVVLTIGGALMNWFESAKATGEENDKLIKGLDDANKKIREQIDNIKTLTDRHEALAAAIEAEAAAREALSAAMEKGGDTSKEQKALKDAMENTNRVRKIGSGDVGGTPEEAALLAQREETAKQLAEGDLSARLQAASPNERMKILEEEAAKNALNAQKAASANSAVAGMSRGLADLDFAILGKQGELNSPVGAGNQAEAGLKKAALRFEIEELQKQRAQLAMTAPEGSSARLSAEALAEPDARKRWEIEQRAESAKRFEARQQEFAMKAQQQQAELSMLKKQTALSETIAAEDRKVAEAQETDPGAHHEVRGSLEGIARSRMEAKSELAKLSAERRDVMSAPGALDMARLDGIAAREAEVMRRQDSEEYQYAFSKRDGERQLERQGAMLGGDAGKITQLDNEETFMQQFQSAISRGMSRTDAAAFATQFTNNAIKLDARDTAFSTQAAAAASSLARIGGGGGVESVTVDPAVAAINQVYEQTKKSADFLEIIAGFKKQPIKP